MASRVSSSADALADAVVGIAVVVPTRRASRRCLDSSSEPSLSRPLGRYH